MGFGGSGLYTAARPVSSVHRPRPARGRTKMIAPSEQNPTRRYRLIAEIGRGGMAEVYLAVAQSPGGFNKLVVIKKTLQNLALQPEILSMFMDEARLAARMNHPNVVQTYELGEEEGRQYIAMEFLDGQPYSRVLSRLRGRAGSAGGAGGGVDGMSFVHHLRVLSDALAGLHHAHELCDFDGSPLQVVHRDISPHNVFITYDGSIKVLDFGIAKTHDSASHTVTGEIKGKISYMSPEQVRGEPLDRRSDIFSMGVLLWEAAAGRRMWADLPDVTVLNELLQGYIPSIREAVPNLPDHLARAIERAVALDRNHRYPTALAMQRELEEVAFLSGLRIDGPEVGRVVSELFDAERRRVRSVIEAQLGSLRWTGAHPAASSLPLISVGPTAGDVSGASQLLPAPARLAGSHTTNPTNTSAALSMRAPTSPSRRWAVIALAGAALAATAVGVMVVSLRGGARRAADATDASPGDPRSPPATSSSSNAPTSVTLKVRVSPAEAKILLDGVLLGGGTYEGKVQRSDSERVLRVEAEGYQAKEEAVSLTSDVMMSLSLEKLEKVDVAIPGASASSPLAAPPSRTSPPPSRPLPPPARANGGRGIDDVSPYK